MARSTQVDSLTHAEIALPDLAATKALARRLATLWRSGDLIALRGDLGAGKTELARAAIQAAAGWPVEVPSPTFTLVQIYEIKPVPVWHFDLYRLTDAQEAVELGWLDARTEGVVLVEWPERLGPLLPDDRLDVLLEEAEGPEARVVKLTAGPSWLDRLSGLTG